MLEERGMRSVADIESEMDAASDEIGMAEIRLERWRKRWRDLYDERQVARRDAKRAAAFFAAVARLCGLGVVS